jgi:Ni,Fe-hydrogenase I small subunit
MTIGCKGLSTKTPCNIYQWNNDVDPTQPTGTLGAKMYCVKAGHPCYGCMEKGYPDKFEAFVKM